MSTGSAPPTAAAWTPGSPPARRTSCCCRRSAPPTRWPTSCLDGWHVAHPECDVKGRARGAGRVPAAVGEVRRAGGLRPEGELEAAGRHRPLDRGRHRAARRRDVHGRLGVPALRATNRATHKMAAKYAYLEKVTGAWRELCRGRPRGRRGRPQHRAPERGHQELEGQPEDGGLPPRGAGLRDPGSTSTAGSTSAACTAARVPGRTRGGRGAARRSTTTRAGASTTSSRRRRSRGRARKVEVDRAPTYAERWSDHAPLVATYEL